MTLKPGLYWAKYNGWWGLVEVTENARYVHYSIPESKGPYCIWPQVLEKYNEVYCIGDERPDDVGQYSEFVKANLVDPDGNPYHNTGDNYTGN